MEDYSLTSGLWKICGSSLGNDYTCHAWNEEITPGDWLKATQGVSAAALLIMAGTIVVCIYHTVAVSRARSPSWLGGVCCFLCTLGGIAMACADVIWVTNYRSGVVFPTDYEPMSPAMKHALEQEFFLDWGFGCDVCSVIFSIMAGVAHAAGANRKRNWTALVNIDDIPS